MSTRALSRRHTPTAHQARRRVGITAIELAIALTLVAIVAVPVSHAILASTRGLATLATRSHVETRLPLVLDRIVEELTPASFASLDPAVPVENRFIRFRQVEGLDDRGFTYGHTRQIDLAPLEKEGANGVDDDEDGLIDEAALRLWTDVEPFGNEPGPEDSILILAEELRPDGLSFTRDGALLRIVLRADVRSGAGQEPTTTTLATAVRIRNP